MKTGKTLIRGGTIVDGTGKAAFRGDVLLEGEKISAVAEGGFQECVSGDVRSIDASGMIVSPGFIDSHSHSDAYLIIEPGAPSKISQGITTEINGQCGGSAAPRYGEARLSSDWASLLADRLVWRSLAGYRDALAKAAPAINTVQFA
ncbi:MAG: amidohydrolase family protein, partial [Kiritimatiellae bacterium]|nr:amidohydrolase family protein [Kiritimatiellia bacterium]